MLPCPTCGANISARNDALGIAACGQCGGLFEWPLIPAPRAPVDRPKRVTVELRDGTVHAVHCRSDPRGVVYMVAGTVAFVAVGWFLFSGKDWWAGLFLIVVGIVTTLWSAIRRAGGIHIRLGPVISIRSGIGPRRHVSPASLRQPFVRVNWSAYDLCAIQEDGTVVTLAEGFTSPIDARCVEHELEAALGIVAAPVPGELDRGARATVDATAPLRALGLVCPACAAPLAAHDVQPGKGQAVCTRCRKALLLGAAVATGPRTLVVLPPPRAVIDRSREAFELEAGLGTGQPVAVRRSVAILSLSAAYYVLEALARANPMSLIAFAGVAVVWGRLGWLFVFQQWSRVRIRVEEGVLDVRVGPIPPRTHRSIPVSNISQVFVRAQPSFWFGTWNEGYQLCALDRSSRAEHQVIPLADRMLDLREARYLEEQLEEYLGIVDAPVAGEVEGKTLLHEPGAPSLPGSGNLSLPDSSSGGELSVPRAAGALSESE